MNSFDILDFSMYALPVLSIMALYLLPWSDKELSKDCWRVPFIEKK